MGEFSLDYIYWAGDRYEDARSSEHLGPDETREVADWCSLFTSDPRLRSYLAGSGMCWFDVPVSKNRRLHLRPHIHTPSDGSRRYLSGMGIYYRQDHLAQMQGFKDMVLLFDAWFGEHNGSLPPDRFDIQIQHNAPKSPNPDMFSLIAFINGRAVNENGGYVATLENVDRLVSSDIDTFFSKYGVACNPPVADYRINIHLISSDFYLPGLSPKIASNDTKTSTSSNKNEQDNGNASVSQGKAMHSPAFSKGLPTRNCQQGTLPEMLEMRKSEWLVFIGVMAVVFFLGLLVGAVWEGQKTEKYHQTIKEQERKIEDLKRDRDQADQQTAQFRGELNKEKPETQGLQDYKESVQRTPQEGMAEAAEDMEPSQSAE